MLVRTRAPHPLATLRVLAALCGAGRASCTVLFPLDDFDRGTASSDSASASGGACAGMYPPLSGFQDDFDDNNPGEDWGKAATCPAPELNGELVFAPPPNTANWYCKSGTSENYRLACDSMTVKVPQ